MISGFDMRYNALLDDEALVYDASRCFGLWALASAKLGSVFARNPFDKGLFNNCWAFWCRSRAPGSVTSDSPTICHRGAREVRKMATGARLADPRRG